MNLFGDRPLTEDERRLVLRAVVALAIPMALIVLLVGIVAFGMYRHEENKRIADTKRAIQSEREIRRNANKSITALAVQFNRVSQWQNFDRCVADARQDTILLSLLVEIPAQDRFPKVDEAIDALTPDPTSPGCVPPPGKRPFEVPRP